MHQIGAPIHRLENYLKHMGVPVTIRRCALFTNEKAELHLTDRKGLREQCPLFLLGSPEFLAYLHKNGSKNLSQAKVLRIVEALKEQVR